MRQIIAIGGGGFGRTVNKNHIEQYIFDQSSKSNPNILFIPTASAEPPDYINNFYKVFDKLSCNPNHLSLFKRTPDLKTLFSSQDIFFIGGGNTKSMLAVWREWGIDKLLREAYINGKIMSGVSAGAICWFEKGITDSWDAELKVQTVLESLKAIAVLIMMRSQSEFLTQKNFLRKAQLIPFIVLRVDPLFIL